MKPETSTEERDGNAMSETETDLHAEDTTGGPSPAVGMLIRKTREDAGLTQEVLAAKLGVSQTAVSYWESAKRDPGVADLLRIACALGVTGASLLPVPHRDGPAVPAKGRLARVEVKGFRDLGIVRVSETTLAGEPMLHAECDDGSAADFPPSSLHFITWLPEGAEMPARAAPAALTDGTVRCACGERKDADGNCPGAWHGCDYHNEGDDDEEHPF